MKYQRILGHPCRAGAMPEPSEAPTHFGQPRAVRAAYRNLVKHQRILGIPNLSATCGVRPLPALSVRYSRCPSATCAVKVQFAMSVRNLRYPSATGVASAGLVKTVTNTPLQKPSRTHAQEVYFSSRFRACKTVTNTHPISRNFAKSALLITFTDRKFLKLTQLTQSSVPPRV